MQFDQHYAFTFVDPLFYESPASVPDDESFDAVRRSVPEGWTRSRRNPWVLLDPVGVELPAQGWKVHVSACDDNAARILDTVWDCCVASRTAFKFLPSRRTLSIFNGKYMPRESSGKFITIYPGGDDELAATVDELSAKLAGEPGPRVLSDASHPDAPVSVRFGGFHERYCTTPDGDCSPAVARPDGVLVPDLRLPVFRPPAWAPIPTAVADLVSLRRAAGGGSLPYRVIGALHFSNGGGVYLAERSVDGVEVVLKEARPHAGLDRAGRDAVSRLHHEYEILRRLSGVPGIPEVYDLFTAGGHHFLAMQRLPGEVIWRWAAAHHPLVHADPSPAALAAHTTRALALADRLADTLDQIHRRGVIYGDLHPGNILVGPDDSVALVDFESCGFTDDPGYRPKLAAAGFRPVHHGRHGVDVDALALSAVRLWLFIAQDRMWDLDPSKIELSLAEAERIFPLPPETVAQLRRDLVVAAPAPNTVAARAAADRPLEVDLAAPTPDIAALCRSLAAAITTSATPQRQDRLFPGDIQQFVRGGWNFAHGAAGILWALHRTGFDIDPRHEQWLLRAADRAKQPRPGFYTGWHGLAHVLGLLGHRDTAARLMDRAAGLVPLVRNPDLYQGLAGIGLNLLHVATATGAGGYLDAAVEIAGRIAAALDAPAGGRDDLPAGLMRGWSGPALFFLRLYEATGDGTYLDAAVRALHRDLDHAVTGEDGALLLASGGGRALPYLSDGTVGTALIVDEVLRHRPDDRLRACLPAVGRAFLPESVVESNLLDGRAGLLAVAARLSQTRPSVVPPDAPARHLRRFAWYALSYQGHLAFPGRRQFRLSMDLATGNAGVLLAFATAANPTLGFLPFLGAEPVTGTGSEAAPPGADHDYPSRR